MAKRNRVPTAFFVAHVTYDNGEKLELQCNDRWTAHEIANRANLMPGVKSAHYDSTGYSLFHNWESAMQSVAAFCNTESQMKSDYLFGKNPLG